MHGWWPIFVVRHLFQKGAQTECQEVALWVMEAPFLLSPTSAQASLCNNCQLNRGLQAGGAKAQGLQISTDAELERMLCVMICIRAKASEHLEHIMLQINCWKADQVTYKLGPQLRPVSNNAVLFRPTIQLIKLSLIFLPRLSYPLWLN